jgi:hypothetical protein
MKDKREALVRIKPRAAEFGPDLPTDPMERLVHFARLAPSSHNSQPWKFVLERDAVDLFADASRWLRVADRDRRELYISLGCALESLLIAADYEGFGSEVKLFPVAGDDNYVCRVGIRRAGPKRDNAAASLVHAMPRRHTSHRDFDKARPVGERELASLRDVADGECVALHYLSASAGGALDELLVRAEAKLFADPGYRAELGGWIGEGALGTSWLVSKLGQLAVTTLPAAERFTRAESGRLASAPHIALLSARGDSAVDQVRAGQAYLRIALMAEAHDVRMQPFSAPLEVAETRAAVAQLFGLGERRPQQLFRLGYAEPETVRTRRRTLSEVLVRA